MLLLYKGVLGPILLRQAHQLRKTALRLPEAAGPRMGQENAAAPEATPLRLLVVGDSSAAGVGVDQQHEALAQPLARLLAARTGRAVTWQLVARSGVNTVEAIELVQASEIAPADFIVTALGTNDVTSQRRPGRFLKDYQALVEALFRRSGAAGLVVTGLPPLHILPAAPHPLRWYLGRYAARLDRLLRRWIDQEARARYVSLQWAAVPEEMARDRFHPGPLQYRRWVEMVAAQVVDLLALRTQRGA